MIPVKMTKERAEYFVACLGDGKPFIPPPGGWSGDEMLAVAGACLAAARSQGPNNWWSKANDTSAMHREHSEMVEEAFDHDLHAGVGFYSQLIEALMFGEWDKQYAADVQALATQTGTLKKSVSPVKGFVGHPDRL